MRGHGNLEDALHIVKVAADNFQRSAAADLTEERRLRFGQRHCAYILRDGCRLNAMVLAQPFIDGLVAKIAGIIYHGPRRIPISLDQPDRLTPQSLNSDSFPSLPFPYLFPA